MLSQDRYIALRRHAHAGKGFAVRAAQHVRLHAVSRVQMIVHGQDKLLAHLPWEKLALSCQIGFLQLLKLRKRPHFQGVVFDIQLLWQRKAAVPALNALPRAPGLVRRPADDDAPPLLVLERLRRIEALPCAGIQHA